MGEPEYPWQLVEFCREVVSKHACQWPPQEETLAKELIRHFGLQNVFTYDNLVKFCTGLGIKVSTASLPKDLAGHNYCYGNQQNIVIHAGQWLWFTGKHTLLHELREILEYILKDLGYPTAKDKTGLEIRAEGFATSVEIDVVSQESKMFLQLAETIQSTWWKRGAFLLIGLFGLARLLSIRAADVWEDQMIPNGG